MTYRAKDHTFAVCAYKESPYLEQCICSLENQTAPGNIILCTATPNAFLEETARRHGIRYYPRSGRPGIARDWNYAYGMVRTPLVTLAHQDDIYEPAFLEKTLRSLNRAEHPLIAFTDYYELRNDTRSYAPRNRNLLLKEILALPLRVPLLGKSRWIRRRILSLGCVICCPSVTYVKPHLPAMPFREDYQADLDWQLWEKLSRRRGSFCYVPEALQGHRIHVDSTTTKVIGSGRNRSGEDLEMFRKFWPEPVARLLNRLYSVSQEQNQIR